MKRVIVYFLAFLTISWFPRCVLGSNRRCGPCEVTNEEYFTAFGAPPCIPLAKGTPVEGEPCKECDGEGNVTNKADGVECELAGKIKGICCGGECIPYSDNCPHPLPTPKVSFVKAGPCSCRDPVAFGCVAPAIYPIPLPNVTICLQSSKWVIVVNSITIEYFEGLCLDNCKIVIDSIDDIHVDNYCDIVAAIHNRINQDISPNPLSQDGVEKKHFCFSECLSAHENVHVEQLDQEWGMLWSGVLEEIRNCSIEFGCQSSYKERQARAQFLHFVVSTMLESYKRFIKRWSRPGRGEIPAEIAEKDCLNSYLVLIEQKASENGWSWPCPQ